MKFKEFVALCNKMELDHHHCGEFDVVVNDFLDGGPIKIIINESGKTVVLT